MTGPELERNTTVFTTLSSTLWRLREVLDQLLFKVFETQLVMRSGQPKWLAKASRELDTALQEVRHVEVMRAVETVSIADQLGLPPDITLDAVAESAPSPWSEIFHEHREALRTLTSDIQHTAADVRLGSAAGDDGYPADEDFDVVRRFLVDTLAKATQTSLTAFLA